MAAAISFKVCKDQNASKPRDVDLLQKNLKDDFVDEP